MIDINGNKTTARAELIRRLSNVEWLPDYDVKMHADAIMRGDYSEREFLEEGKDFYTMSCDPAQYL